MGFIHINITGKEKIKNFSVLTKGAYIITEIGNVSIDGKAEIKATPFALKNGTIITSSNNSGGLIILGTGEELGLMENTSVKISSNKKIELLSGSINFLNSSSDFIILKWKNNSFIIKDKAFFSIHQIKKKRNLFEDQLYIKVYGNSIKAIVNNKRVILNKQYNYILNENEIISEYKMLPAPKLIEPEDLKHISIDEGNNLLFKWEAISGAKSYNFYFSYNSIFINPVLIKTKKSNTTLSITDFKESPVRWKVCAIDSAGEEGVCSKVRSFHIKNLIQILQLWKNPPLLKIEEPLSPTGNLVIIKGKTDLGVNLTINGEEVTIDSSGNFMHILRFNSIGEHQITIVAKNLSGAKKVYTKSVIIYEK